METYNPTGRIAFVYATTDKRTSLKKYFFQDDKFILTETVKGILEECDPDDELFISEVLNEEELLIYKNQETLLMERRILQGNPSKILKSCELILTALPVEKWTILGEITEGKFQGYILEMYPKENKILIFARKGAEWHMFCEPPKDKIFIFTIQ